MFFGLLPLLQDFWGIDRGYPRILLHVFLYSGVTCSIDVVLGSAYLGMTRLHFDGICLHRGGWVETMLYIRRLKFKTHVNKCNTNLALELERT